MSNITDDYALHYEAVIREAFDCERYGANGIADADKYRKLLGAYLSLMQSIDNDNESAIKTKKKEFYEECRTISKKKKKAVDKLEEKNGSFSGIKSLLPQTTIHGINIVIDRILDKTRKTNK